VLDPGHERPVFPFEFDRDLQAIVLRSAVHDDVGDCLLEAELDRERNVGRHLLVRPALDPSGQPIELGEVVAQHQTSWLHAWHRDHDVSAAAAALALSWIGINASIFAVFKTLATLLSGHRMTSRPPLPLTILAPTSSTRIA